MLARLQAPHAGTAVQKGAVCQVPQVLHRGYSSAASSPDAQCLEQRVFSTAAAYSRCRCVAAHAAAAGSPLDQLGRGGVGEAWDVLGLGQVLTQFVWKTASDFEAETTNNVRSCTRFLDRRRWSIRQHA